MVKLYLWLLLLIAVVLLIFTYFYFAKDIFSPPFLFVAGFTISIAVSIAEAANWGTEIHINTFAIVSTGLIVFVVGCIVTKYICNQYLCRNTTNHVCHIESNKIKSIISVNVFKWFRVSNFALGIFLIFELITLLITILYLEIYANTSDIFEAISIYRYDATFTEKNVSFGFPLNQMRSLCFAFSYIVLFLLARQIVNKDRHGLALLVACTVSSMLLFLEIGSRSPVISYVFFFFVALYYLMYRNNKKNIRKVVIFVIILGIAIIALFPFLAKRGSSVNYIENIGVYLGCEIPNFDYYLNNMVPTTPSLFGYMTFVKSINWIGEHFNISQFVYPLDLPFVVTNNIQHGNVFTTFYAFYYDFKLPGVIIMTFIMSIISYISYYLVIRSGSKHSFVPILFYGMISSTIFLSFFSNKFYESIISISMIFIVIYIAFGLLLYCFICHIAFIIKRYYYE